MEVVQLKESHRGYDSHLIASPFSRTLHPHMVGPLDQPVDKRTWGEVRAARMIRNYRGNPRKGERPRKGSLWL